MTSVEFVDINIPIVRKVARGYNQVLSVPDIKKLAPSGFHIMARTGFATSVETVNCYPDEWIRIYTEEGYMLYDPVLRWAYENTGSRRWSDLSANDPKRILKIAAAFGLNFGLVIAFTNTGGDSRRTIASFARPDREFDSFEVVHLEAHVKELHGKSSGLSGMTGKEIEVLRLLKDGLQIKEISARLNVSESAVKQRLTNSKSKLDARTTAQAVAILTVQGAL